MRLAYYQISESGDIDEVSRDIFFDHHARHAGLFCIDIREPQVEELEQWLEELNVSAIAKELCLRPKNVSAVVPLDKEVYFEYPVIASEPDSAPREAYVSTLCLDGLLLTIEPAGVTEAERIIDLLKSQPVQVKTSLSELLGALLARESFQATQMVDKLRTAVYRLDERMDRDPDSVEAEEILDQKRLLRLFDTLVNGQATCLEQLRVLSVAFLASEQRSAYLQLAAVNALAASQAVARLDKTISDMSQRYDTNQQEKTNHRLAILTILSAIFMPLTFIAGIYGMNFEIMPELRFAWAYPAVIGLMLIIALGMYRFFKTRGWLE